MRGSTDIEITGSGKDGGSSSTSMLGIAEGVARGDVLDPHDRGDVAGVAGLDVLLVIGLDLDQAPHAFLAARARVVDLIPFADHVPE